LTALEVGYAVFKSAPVESSLAEELPGGSDRWVW